MLDPSLYIHYYYIHFFLLIVRKIKMKTFLWAPESVVGSRCCTYYPHWINQPCLTDEMREPLTSQNLPPLCDISTKKLSLGKIHEQVCCIL